MLANMYLCESLKSELTVKRRINSASVVIIIIACPVAILFKELGQARCAFPRLTS